MKYCDIKRFVELWIGDSRFRDDFRVHPSEAVRRRRLDVDSDKVRCLVDESLEELRDLPRDIDPSVAGFLRRIEGIHRRDAQKRLCLSTANQSYSRWRARQAARLSRQMHSYDASRYGCGPYAIELSKGCSLACRYCGFDAGRLAATALFAENEQLYRDVLRTLSRFFGAGAEGGMLFWATDPLDNPDLEAYLRAFHDEFGVVSGLTTALWFRQPERARALIHLMRELNVEPVLSRFSVNSLRQLDLCCKTFSAEELEYVQVCSQTKGSLRPKWEAGRGRQVNGAVRGSLATVAGFLINLPERTVKLITPTLELERWPLGYRVFAEGSFEGASGLWSFMEDCRRRFMEFEMDETFVPRLGDYMTARTESGRVTLTSYHRQRTLPEGLASRLAQAINGEDSIAAIVRNLLPFHDGDAVRNVIEAWWRLGLIEDLDERYQAERTPRAREHLLIEEMRRTDADAPRPPLHRLAGFQPERPTR